MTADVEAHRDVSCSQPAVSKAWITSLLGLRFQKDPLPVGEAAGSRMEQWPTA